MSAWMTTDIHRSALVQEAQVRGLVNPAEADRLWQQMTWENQYALRCRYGDELPHDTWEDVPCKRQVAEAPLDPWAILKGINCWSYQCAEFHGYDETSAHILMDGLIDLIAAELEVPRDESRGGYYTRREYNLAPWGIDTWDQVIRVPSQA